MFALLLGYAPDTVDTIAGTVALFLDFNPNAECHTGFSDINTVAQAAMTTL